MSIQEGDFIHSVVKTYYPNIDFGSDALLVIRKAILDENGAFRVFEMCQEYFNSFEPSVVVVLYGSNINNHSDHKIHVMESKYGNLYEYECGTHPNDLVASGSLFEIIFNVYSGPEPARVIWISNGCSYVIHPDEIVSIFDAIKFKLKSEFFAGV